MPIKEIIFKEKKIKIIKNHDDFLIVYKPAGLIVHGGPGVKEKALSDILIAHFPSLKKVGEDPNRPGIVHRLDKEVGGLLIVPKNNNSFLFFKDQFKNRLINKEYTALVHGQVIKDEDSINFPIARSKKNGKMAALPLKIGQYKKKKSNRDLGNINSLLSAREAQTNFIVEKRLINFTLLKITINTGRTHQIRVHLGAYGYPIVGDNIYSGKKCRLKNKKINLNRIFLEADYLSFIDQHKKKQEFRQTLTTNLQSFLNKLN